MDINSIDAIARYLLKRGISIDAIARYLLKHGISIDVFDFLLQNLYRAYRGIYKTRLPSIWFTRAGKKPILAEHRLMGDFQN